MTLFFEQIWELHKQGGFDGECVLQTESTKFVVSKLIISVQSSVFKEQLANNVSQLILNKTPEVVEQLVEFLYRGRCSNAQPYAKELFLLGEEYKVEKLKNYASDSLGTTLQRDNLLDRLELAFVHGNR